MERCAGLVHAAKGRVPAPANDVAGHILAAIRFQFGPMARPAPKPTPLRETPSAAPLARG